MALLASLAGCSEMMFADQDNLVPEKDPREDIVLTNVSTQMTSGGLVQQGIKGGNAVFSSISNDLIIENMSVTTYSDGSETRSMTRADVGQVFFADDKSRDVERKDMKFSGNVLYRTPQKNDPTSDSLRMTSDLIIWSEGQKKFICPTDYTMWLYPKGKPPIRQGGKGFEATEELSRFVVKAGQISTDMDSERLNRAELLAQFEEWKREADSDANRPINIPLTIPPTAQ